MTLLTEAQRKVAIAYLSVKASDELLSCAVWQANNLDDASAEACEIAAIYCEATVASSAKMVDSEDATVRANAQNNVATYGRRAAELRERHIALASGA